MTPTQEGLKGEALEKRLDELNITGTSDKTADEKRSLIAAAEAKAKEDTPADPLPRETAPPDPDEDPEDAIEDDTAAERGDILDMDDMTVEKALLIQSKVRRVKRALEVVDEARERQVVRAVKGLAEAINEHGEDLDEV